MEVVVCDESGDNADNRWLVNPWILDLASSSLSDYTNEACSFTTSGTTILEANGLPFGANTCVGGVVVSDADIANVLIEASDASAPN